MTEERDRAGLAAAALAAAKADAQARGVTPLRRRPWVPAGSPADPDASWGSDGDPTRPERAAAGSVPPGTALAATSTSAGSAGSEPQGSALGAASAPPGSAAGSAPPGSELAAGSAPPETAPTGRSRPAGLPPTSAKRRRRDDPAPLQAAIDGLIAESGWALAAATGSVFGRWAQIVGPDLAAHTAPDRLEDGELVVTADSTAWATQVRLLAADLVRRLNIELGNGTVRRVRVLGPAAAAASRQPGQWRVKGSRGPRDTYG